MINSLQNGKYAITKELGSGGFGITYEAVNSRVGKRVAIKEFFMSEICGRGNDGATVVIPIEANLATFERQKNRFLQEAGRRTRLSHPHIVQVHDCFEENGTAYYVMDYIEGENLAARLSRTGQPMDEAEALKIFEQVLDALEYIHGQEPPLLHLDIKPSNLIIKENDDVVLIDFGASKNVDEDGKVYNSIYLPYTRGFAPREQMEQDIPKIGSWTDFYSLGATLYNLLTNRQPPLPSDIDDDMTEDKHEAMPFPAKVSEQTRKLILLLMSALRSKRPQSVDEIRNLLKQDEDAPKPYKKEEDAPKPKEEDIPTKPMNEEAPTIKAKETAKETEGNKGTTMSVDNVYTKDSSTPPEGETPSDRQQILEFLIAVVVLLCILVAPFVLTKKEKEKEPVAHGYCPDENHPHAIDLGLPSGVKWSCCNVGADQPEEGNEYYAWGETKTKSDYSDSTSKYHRVSKGDISGTNDDVAHVKWGEQWRMPTKEDIDQLLENTSDSVMTYHGVKGMLFTGKNGNSIFLPFAGYREGSLPDLQDSCGFFWSGTPLEGGKEFSYYLRIINDGSANCLRFYRYYGRSVRPVYVDK